MKKSVSMVIMIVFIMSGCEEKYNYNGCKDSRVLSYKEVRAEYPKVVKAKEIGKAAKIYNYKDGDVLLVNELNKGIHVIDNTNRQKPIRKSFIEIPGNVDMAVKDGYLYADSFTDLVVLDIHDLDDIKIVSRKESIFPEDFEQMSRSYSRDTRCNDRYYGDTHGFVVMY